MSEPAHIKAGRLASAKITESDAREILITKMQPYIERSEFAGKFISDIALMGGTFGDFYGSYDTGSASRSYIEVKLADGRIFKVSKLELYNNQAVQVALL